MTEKCNELRLSKTILYKLIVVKTLNKRFVKQHNCAGTCLTQTLACDPDLSLVQSDSIVNISRAFLSTYQHMWK